MESGLESGSSGARSKRRRSCVVVGVLLLVLLVVVVVALALTLRPKPDEVRQTFMQRCEAFKGYDCQKLWVTFEQVYVGKDACNVPVEAYDPLFAAAALEPACNRMMFWSKTKDVVHDFTDKRDCFVTLEDTLLGSVLDGLTWCGREGSSETFTSSCPGWSDCENNPVRSFWIRASADFADDACGHVTAMLSGSIATPFSPSSIFGSVEVPRFNSTRVKSLTVVLVTQQDVLSNCTNPSFNDLQKALDDGIKYNCEEVTESQLQQCSSDPAAPCGPCW